ncbi:MAG TPA: hypothetical protein PL182_10725 [Pseudobdellovibrionaceae bacterium]|nr:hypothetical protein [Pseudobdellovibrionaceae bacterium]
MRGSFCLFAVFLSVELASAKTHFDVDVAYLQESRTTSSTSTRTGLFYSGGLFLDATGKEKFYLGAVFAAGAVTDAGASRQSFSHQDMMLAARWFVDRQKLLCLSGGYGVVSRASLKEASGSPLEQWEGTSLYAKITLAPEIRRWTVGVSLIYHQGNYVEKTVQGTTTSDTFQRTMIWPALSLGYKW